MAVGRTSSTGLPWLVASSDLTNSADIIYPTSVAGTGVTLLGGQVSFSAATSVNVNGCFTSAYDNYKIIVWGISASNDSLLLRLLSSGNTSITNYQTQYTESYGTTTQSTSYATLTSELIGQWGSFWNNITDCTISNPAISSSTAFISNTAYMQSSAQLRGFTGWGVHTTNTAYDGFQIRASGGGALTGNLRIYGLRNY